MHLAIRKASLLFICRFAATQHTGPTSISVVIPKGSEDFPAPTQQNPSSLAALEEAESDRTGHPSGLETW